VPGKQGGKKKSSSFIVFIPKYNGHKDIMVRGQFKVIARPEMAALLSSVCLILNSQKREQLRKHLKIMPALFYFSRKGK